jgi:hypothetical protein
MRVAFGECMRGLCVEMRMGRISEFAELPAHWQWPRCSATSSPTVRATQCADAASRWSKIGRVDRSRRCAQPSMWPKPPGWQTAWLIASLTASLSPTPLADCVRGPSASKCRRLPSKLEAARGQSGKRKPRHPICTPPASACVMDVAFVTTIGEIIDDVNITENVTVSISANMDTADHAVLNRQASSLAVSGSAS